MKKTTATLLAGLALLGISSCSSEKQVAFSTAEHYFVKNDIGDIETSIYDNDSSFNAVFGMAAVMGKGGQPTNIDFSKQFAIGVVLPVTDQYTELNAKSLVKNGDKLTLTYQAAKGQKISYTMRPCMILVVDNANKGELVLIEADK